MPNRIESAAKPTPASAGIAIGQWRKGTGMAPPYFFLSYAAENDDAWLRRFYEELDNDVANLPGGPLKKGSGFIDSAQTRGTEWNRNLQDALAETRVMVCMYSPVYFQKLYCGIEMEVMLRRRRRYQQEKPNAQPSNIIPIRWWPLENPATQQTTTARTLPKFLVSRDPASVYEQQGLRYMMETAAHQAEYVNLRRGIARDIVIAANRFTLPTEPLASLVGVSSAFVPRPVPLDPRALDRAVFGPKSATCVYVGRPGWHIDPAVLFRPPDEDAVTYICASVAERLQTRAYEFPIDPASTGAFDILEHIAGNNGRVVVVVDSSVIHIDPFQTWLRTYDEKRFPNCATIILGDARELRVGDVLPLSASEPRVVFHAPKTADALDAAVETSLAILHDVIALSSNPGSPIDRATEHRTIPGFSGHAAA